MLNFIASRVLQAVLVLAFSSVILFVLLHILPGDPAAVIAGPDAKPADVAAIRERLDLGGSPLAQYGRWVANLVRGDLGNSLVGNRPVSGRLSQAIPPTVELAVSALAVALLIGVPFGVIAGSKPGSAWDWALAAFAGVALGVPGFYLGILGLLLFAVELDWLPAAGRVAFTTDPIGALQHLALPAITLGLSSAAVFARFVRTAVQASLREDYVRTARARGAGQGRIVLRHVLPNSLISLITVGALQAGRLLGGAVITEQVFAWPGLGRLVVDAVLQRDYLVVQGVLVVFVAAFVLVNLLADILYGIADPRVRVQ